MEIVMKSFSLFVSGVIALEILASPALAASRTFVSGAGADSGNCALSAPCRTFAYTITQTSAGGEMVVLSSAGYGSVTITQSITISSPDGIEGAITVASGQAGITITAPSASVTLRGLTLLGGGVGNNGILVNSAGTLAIINCNISDMSPTVGNGIAFVPSSGSLSFVIDGSYISGNFDGILVSTTAFMSGSIQRTTIQRNGSGLALFGGETGPIMLDNALVTGNTTGVNQQSNTPIYFTRSAITNNGTGMNAGVSTPISYGDNRFNGNGSDGGFTTTSLK
jgi:hypothetical protein